MLFPSVNYTYIDIDTNKIASNINSATNQLQGYSSGTGQTSAMNNIAAETGNQIKDILGGDDAHMASVNLYRISSVRRLFVRRS